MPLITNVKINAVTNLSDARYGAGMGVNLMGFCLDTANYKYIEAAKMSAITQWISGVQIVFEFDKFDFEQYELAIDAAVPQYIQVNCIDEWDMLEKTAVPIIHRIDMDHNHSDLATLVINSPAYYILLDGLTSDFVEEQSILLKTLCENKKICLGGVVNKHNIISILDTINPWGIAIEGGEEEKPGLKSFEEMADIFELLEEE